MTTQRLTAVILARYSPRNEKGARGKSIGAADREKNSCDVQIADLIRHAESMGYIVDPKLIFRDDAKSGKSERNRPGLAGALAACGASLDPAVKVPLVRGRILLCRDTKRLARNMLDAFSIVRQLMRRGAAFETLRSGRFDASDPMKFAYFGFEAIMAEVERMNISKTTREKVRRYQDKDNRRMSLIPPYGKCKDPADPALWRDEPEEQSVIRRIVTEHATGLTLRAIGRGLVEAGILNRGKRWGHKTLGRIIRRAATPA